MDESISKSSVTDKRYLKNIIRSLLAEHVRDNLSLVLAVSPGAFVKDLEIAEPSVQEVHLLGSFVNIEDRKINSTYWTTTERVKRTAADYQANLFEYNDIKPSLDMQERSFPLSTRDQIVTCHWCNGKAELLKDCEFCSGKGYEECPICRGNIYEQIKCPECEGRLVNYSGTQCTRCNGSGLVSQLCHECKGKGVVNYKPCQKCSDGKVRVPCEICKGTGHLLQRDELIVRERPEIVTAQPLDPGITLPQMYTEAMEHVYTSPLLTMQELKSFRSPLDKDVWERAVKRATNQAFSVVSSGDDQYQSKINTIQFSIYRTKIIRALFTYKDNRSGSIWIVLGNKQQPIDYSVDFVPFRFSDNVIEFIGVLLSFAVGAIFSWYFGNWFPFLSISLCGVFLIIAFRVFDWRKEFGSFIFKGLFALIILLGVVGILTTFVQIIGQGMSGPEILALISMAVMTSFAIIGIRSDVIKEFFIELLSLLLNK